MKLSDIIKKYRCTVYTPELLKEKTITYAFCTDLMSDALMILNTVSNPKIIEQSILITGLATNQAIRTAEMLDGEVVLLVRGKRPSAKVIELAIESNILLIGTCHTMFNVSGNLFRDGIKGIDYNEQC